MRIPSLYSLLAGLVLSLTFACGGAHTSDSTGDPAGQAAIAEGLSYKDPASTGWRLVKDASSTSTRLVLNLVGPAGLKTRGVGFNLQAPSSVKFGTFSNGLPIGDTGVYQLLSASSADPNEPVALTGGVKEGNLLTVGIFQKDRAQGPKDSGSALCQIVLLPGDKLRTNSLIALTVPKAKIIPEDIGSVTDELWLLDKKMKMADITISLGTLTAR